MGIVHNEVSFLPSRSGGVAKYRIPSLCTQERLSVTMGNLSMLAFAIAIVAVAQIASVAMGVRQLQADTETVFYETLVTEAADTLDVISMGENGETMMAGARGLPLTDGEEELNTEPCDLTDGFVVEESLTGQEDCIAKESVNGTWRFKYVGCPRASNFSIPFPEVLTNQGTKSMAECRALCEEVNMEYGLCNAIEVNNCLEDPECLGPCWFFTLPLSELTDKGACVQTGTQRTFAFYPAM